MAGDRIPIVDGAADTGQIAAFERDRRELIRGGLRLGGAAIAASSIPLLLSVRNAFAASGGDADILANETFEHGPHFPEDGIHVEQNRLDDLFPAER